MEPLVRNQADEVSALVMENELLRYEITHLRARLAAAEKAARKGERSLEQMGAVPPTRGTAIPAAGEEQSQVREDLVWLLERLDASPIGPLMRRRAGIRVLRDRYLRGDGT